MNLKTYTGKNVTVAFLDTGIHPHKAFGNRILAFRDFISNKKYIYDDNGHGTHVAGILGGACICPESGVCGMAPGCNLIMLKVLDRFGNGNKEDVLLAYDWILQNRQQYKIRIVNISVGTTYHSQKDFARLIEGVERLWDAGIVVVAAAGNEGPQTGSITAPGCSKKVITVGSSDLLNGSIQISGRGPTCECIMKPDLVAPGKGIVSCLTGTEKGYVRKSGTSMSTPFVSGAIACMLEKNPSLSNLQIKMMLKEATDDLGLARNQQGWGRFNLEKFMKL